jgi:hypothetical protein
MILQDGGEFDIKLSVNVIFCFNISCRFDELVSDIAPR